MPQPLAVRLEAAPEQRLVEEVALRPLTARQRRRRARPFEVYARPIPLDQQSKAGSPRIALMVGGLGLNVEGTRGAIANLPGMPPPGLRPYGAAIVERSAESTGGRATRPRSRRPDGGLFGFPRTMRELYMLKHVGVQRRQPRLVALVDEPVHWLRGGRQLSRRQNSRAEKHEYRRFWEIAARGAGYLDDGSRRAAWRKRLPRHWPCRRRERASWSTPIPRPRALMRRSRDCSILRVRMESDRRRLPPRRAPSNDWPGGRNALESEGASPPGPASLP